MHWGRGGGAGGRLAGKRMKWPVSIPESHFLASLPYHSGESQGSRAGTMSSQSEDSEQAGTQGTRTLGAQAFPGSGLVLKPSFVHSDGEQGTRVCHS